MTIWHFPVLCWQLTDEQVFGQVLGTEIELVAGSVKKLVASLSKRMQRDLDVNLGAYSRPIDHPSLTTQKVSVRPAYREVDGFYPASAPIDVPIASVHGANDFSSFTCYLPALGADFHYYKEGQAAQLVEYFARTALQDATPEGVHRLLLLPAPWLERVSVEVREAGRRGPRLEDPGAQVRTLAAVAERVPLAKKERRQSTAFPTAAWQREEIVARIATKLREERASVLVVGESGVGKSAILHEAVESFHAATISEEKPRGCYAWRTTPQRMISGARYLGDWQEICEKIATELQRSGDLLWLTDFADLLRVGGHGAEDSIAAFLQPQLDRGELQIVGELTPRELDAARSRLPGFVDRFQVVTVDEMPRARMIKVLDQFAATVKQSTGVDPQRDAMEMAWRLLKRHVPYERFPGKALRFLSGCLSEALLSGRPVIGADDVVRLFVERTGLPEALVRDDMALDEEALRRHFESRIVGQEEAVARIAGVVRVLKTGLNDPGKPVATMLFAGPTGVGKTASARALAEYVYGAGQRTDPMVRLDMSEFQHPAQIERLIGSGGEPGKLVQLVRERPFSVVLLDEIEKAHPVFFDALLTVLDEGILVDAVGRTTDFRNAIIILTTNLGARRGASLGFGHEAPPSYEADIRAFFRPEFYNRIDQLVTFRPLSREVVEEIARKELREVAAREGFVKRRIRVEFTEALVRHIAETGFDPVYGARPLQRAIEQRVVGPVAKFLVAHRVTGVLNVDYRDGLVAITRGQ